MQGSCARAWLYKSSSENALFLLKKYLLYSPRHLVYSNDEQGRVYQNCKFQKSHYGEYVLFSSLSILFPLIAIVLMDYDAAFLYNC